MSLLIGSVAPDFIAQTTEGQIAFHDWLGFQWGLLFSHPADFTPVCTTEVGAIAALRTEFEKRRVKVLGLSIDDVESHHRWIADIQELHFIQVTFPIIADADRRIADLYGMLGGVQLQGSKPNQTIRSVFIIDPAKVIRLTLSYPETTGRNFTEIIRVIDSLQLADGCGVSTPANWKQGDDCLVPANVSSEEAIARFPLGVAEQKPYLRYTPQPPSSSEVAGLK